MRREGIRPISPIRLHKIYSRHSAQRGRITAYSYRLRPGAGGGTMVKLLHEWVTAQANRAPEAVALAMGPEAVTYGELDRLSNQLARTLKDGGCKQGDRVCLLAPKSPAAIVAILGILKADCIYVPLDLASPAPRLTHMIASAEPRCILAMGPAASLLDGLWAAAGPPRSIAVGWMGS